MRSYSFNHTLNLITSYDTQRRDPTLILIIYTSCAHSTTTVDTPQVGLYPTQLPSIITAHFTFPLYTFNIREPNIGPHNERYIYLTNYNRDYRTLINTKGGYIYSDYTQSLPAHSDLISLTFSFSII
jgi:hypothetical protein